MNGNRERLAWAFLIGSFLLCFGLFIGVIFGTTTFLQTATRPLSVVAQANEGTVVMYQEGATSQALRAGEAVASINPAARIITSANDTALLQVFPPDSDRLLARVQIYGNSNVYLMRAEMPRFQFNQSDPLLALDLESGRLRLALPQLDGQPFVTEVSTPQGAQITIQEPGQYSLEVSNAETQVTVQEGQLLIAVHGTVIALGRDERAVIPLDAPLRGPLDSERNLVQNGNFSQGGSEWISLAWNLEIPTEPPGQTSIVTIGGERALRFSRNGQGHADASVRQIIDQDVTDYTSLRLEVSLLIYNQSIGVCGVQGSECPLMIRIDYVDATGVDRFWQQGIYATGELTTESPDICRLCPPPQPEHHRVTLGQLSFFSADLISELQQQGFPLPRHIKSLSLNAAGHAFQTDVLEVALIAEE